MRSGIPALAVSARLFDSLDGEDCERAGLQFEFETDLIPDGCEDRCITQTRRNPIPD